MRIVVLSDIHGNLSALEAVLADSERHGADLTVNLGDILSGPLQPAETADRLIGLGLPTIRGNQDRQLLTVPPERMGLSDAYAHRCITERHRAWIDSLPSTLWVDDDAFACHGTPTSDLDYFLDTVETSGSREATDEEAGARAGDVRAALILCGHTHLPRARRLRDGRLVVNPGSVGLPAYQDDHPYPHVMEAGSPHARYALVERGPDGAWTAELISVPYDWHAAARIAEERGRRDWAVALASGRT